MVERSIKGWKRLLSIYKHCRGIRDLHHLHGDFDLKFDQSLKQDDKFSLIILPFTVNLVLNLGVVHGTTPRRVGSSAGSGVLSTFCGRFGREQIQQLGLPNK